MKRLILKGGRAIDPASRVDGPFDLILDDGQIAGIVAPGGAAGLSDADTLDCTGCWIMPGLIDPHVHLRDPGFPQKETIATGLRAAAAGGFVAVAAMANTRPVNDTPQVMQYMVATAAAIGGARLIPVSAVTRGLEGRDAVDFDAMAAAGAGLFSDDGMPIDDSKLLREAYLNISRLGLAISLHEEDRALSAGRAINDGSVARMLGVGGIPTAAEYQRIERDIELARDSSIAVHIAHISTAESVGIVRRARRAGVRVTCEAAPHHFILDDSAVLRAGADAKMSPPLRNREDVDALCAALADGTIDMIATDHAPHDPDSKNQAILGHDFPRREPLAPDHAQAFTVAANGVVGLETALGLTMRLVDRGVISPMRMAELMSSNPAKLLRLDAGGLRVGAPADITVIDPNAAWNVAPANFHSRSRNTPFAGMELKGKALVTLAGGKIIHDGRPGASQS